MTKRLRYAVEISEMELALDRYGPEELRSLFPRFGINLETGQIEEFPSMGNWHLGMVVREAICSILAAFPPTCRPALHWSCHPEDAGRYQVFKIVADAEVTP